MNNTTIIVKNGSGKPEPDSLQQAELAIDVASGDLYTKLADDSVALLNDGADDVDLSDYVKEAPEDTKQYARQDGDWSEIVIPDGGTGSSVHIGENPPADPQEGQQWMEVPTDGDATMWIYDGGKWLQQPGGKDGAAGVDGNISDGTTDGTVATWNSTANSGAGQWTPNNNATIDATGNATFSGGLGIGPEGLHHTFAISNSVDGDVFSINPEAPSLGSEVTAGYSKVARLNAYNWASGNTTPLSIRCSDFFIDDTSTGRESFRIVGGNATFSGTVSASSFETPEANGNHFSLSAANFTEADTGTEIAYYGMTLDASVDYWTRFSGYTGVAFYTNGLKRMSIDAAGDATFSGTVSASQYIINGTRLTGANNGLIFGYNANGNTHQLLPTDSNGTLSNGVLNLGASGNRYKNIYGTTARMDIVIQDGSPVIDARGLIKTLSTLRNATKDETTIKGLRDAIGNAIGGLIEEFESQIAAMPAEDEA